MSLGSWLGDKKDAVVVSLVVSTLNRKLAKLVKGGSAVGKFLDGNKNRLTVLIMVIASTVAVATGTDYKTVAQGIIKAIGGSDSETLWATVGVIAGHLWGLYLVFDSYRKARAQVKAGATVAEVNSPAGVMKAEVARQAKEEDVKLEWNKIGEVPEIKDLASVPKPSEAPVAPAAPAPNPKLSDVRSKKQIMVGTVVLLNDGSKGVVIGVKEQSANGYTYSVAEMP